MSINKLVNSDVIYYSNYIDNLVKEMAYFVLNDNTDYNHNMTFSDNFTDMLVEKMSCFVLDDTEKVENINIAIKNTATGNKASIIKKVNIPYNKKNRTIIGELNKVLFDLNYVYNYRDILYLNINGIKNQRMLLNKNFHLRIEMEEIVRDYRTKNNKKAYLYFTKNKNHIGQFSICVSLTEKHNKIEIFTEAYTL